MNIPTPETRVTEPEREVPVIENADVIVCGGGPAGAMAALAAARNGAKTRLIEAQGCLGGVWTSGLMSYVIDAANKTGLPQELMTEFRARGAMDGCPNAFDPERVKFILEEKLTAAGVKLRYHTQVAATLKTADASSIQYVITESKSGREAWAATTFIDCTGDGDLAALAGCQFDVGHPETGATQPMSLCALITGVKPEDMAPYLRGDVPEIHKKRFRDLLTSLGVAPSYAMPTFFHLRDDLYLLMSNHQYNVSATDAEAITHATIEARAELSRQIEALRASGGIWRNAWLAATPARIGVREGRRIRGLYQIRKDDLIEGKRHKDAICQCSFGVDIHALSPNSGEGYHNDGVRVKPYDIPYRALVAADVDNLLLAGRCVSGDFFAHASYRVTGDATAMGEAVGTAAAVCARQRLTPRETSWETIQKGVRP